MREAVSVFNDQENLDAAIAELEVTAFSRQDISVLGPSKDVAMEYGSDTVNPSWLEDSPDAPRGISIRPEEKRVGAGFIIGVSAYAFGCVAALSASASSSIGLLAAITGGSLLGGAVGFIVMLAIGSRMCNRAERQVSKGGLLFWVRTPDTQRERIACDILRKHGGKHIHIHSIA